MNELEIGCARKRLIWCHKMPYHSAFDFIEEFSAQIKHLWTIILDKTEKKERLKKNTAEKNKNKNARWKIKFGTFGNRRRLANFEQWRNLIMITCVHTHAHTHMAIAWFMADGCQPHSKCYISGGKRTTKHKVTSNTQSLWKCVRFLWFDIVFVCIRQMG